jgi:hypothetical protein
LDDQYRKFGKIKTKINQKKNENIDFEMSKNDSNSKMFKNTDGFSIGIKPNKDLNLKKKRKEDILIRNQEINNIFGFQNITSYNKPFFDINNYQNIQKRSLTEESIRQNIKNLRKESLCLNKIKNKNKIEAVKKR